MTSLLDMSSGRLSPTATYAVREWRWVPGECSRGDGRIGSLTIILQYAERNGRRKPVASEWDTYGVEEEHDRPLPPGVRSFLLANDTDPEQPDVYRCVVGADANGLVYDACTCRAGAMKKPCKHVDAIDRLITDGVI